MLTRKQLDLLRFIQQRMQGDPGRERVTYWCAACQAGPAVTPAAISDA